MISFSFFSLVLIHVFLSVCKSSSLKDGVLQGRFVRTASVRRWTWQELPLAWALDPQNPPRSLLREQKPHHRQTPRRAAGLSSLLLLSNQLNSTQLNDNDDDETQNSVIVLEGGVDKMRDDTDHELDFRQESFFNWTFGVEEPGFLGLIHLGTRQTSASLLFTSLRSFF